MEYEIEAEYSNISAHPRPPAYGSIIPAAPTPVFCIMWQQYGTMDGDLILMGFWCWICELLRRPYAHHSGEQQILPIASRDVYNAVLRVQTIGRWCMWAWCEDFQYRAAKDGKWLSCFPTSPTLMLKNQIRNHPIKLFHAWNGHHLVGCADIGDHYMPLPSGAVCSPRPSIYIREEGIGIRIENDIADHRQENMTFMKECPGWGGRNWIDHGPFNPHKLYTYISVSYSYIPQNSLWCVRITGSIVCLHEIH